ncbi:GGDEF domain-containing protein [Undibacterium sp. MH2W]|uniref:GGDEF domain-containing protein n=1 Tax=Undibacterium sp. MH2W TaxID=3413044 RepID=UPI003BF28B89
MESTIQHLVKITGYRDHDLLNISIASSLREIVDAASVRVFELMTSDSGPFLRSKVDITATDVKLVDHQETIDLTSDESAAAEIQAAIAARLPLIETITDSGLDIYFFLWNDQKLEAVIRLCHPAKHSVNIVEVLKGMMVVFRNFHALLDYHERDSLTGLLNRKTFEDSYTKLLRLNTAAPRVGAEGAEADAEQAHWLAIVDIDHFKRVNDQLGHLYGDEVLILIANLMRGAFGSDDYLFRFGGEQFLILLHATTLEKAQAMLDQFRIQVEQHHFPQVGQITLSIGFSRIDHVEPWVAIVGRADQALYYAKTHGRNQCCHYDHLVSNGDLHQEFANDIAEFF